MQCQYSKSRTLEHESPPTTTRPGLPPIASVFAIGVTPLYVDLALQELHQLCLYGVNVGSIPRVTCEAPDRA